jgi:4-hydroxy-tetrahydrodipicolinate reductase
MRKINAVLFGTGAMGRLMAAYLHGKGINIVGAFSRTSCLGEDLGTVAGLAEPLGVRISSSPEQVLFSGKVDIAVIATCSDMQSLLPVAELCVRSRINVLTIAEQAFYPWPFVPEVVERLDQAAKQYGVTVLATGVQDIFWLVIPTALTGACHSINSVLGQSVVNLDLYGSALASQYPLDLTEAEYEVVAKTAPAKLPFFGIALEALVSNLGLTATSRKSSHVPLYDSADIESPALGRVVKKGKTCGVQENYEVQTREGIHFRVEFVEKLCRKDEHERIAWSVRGTPDVSITMDDIRGPEITCATTVNRIPDVLAAAPGFIHAGQLPPARYRADSILSAAR